MTAAAGPEWPCGCDMYVIALAEAGADAADLGRVEPCR